MEILIDSYASILASLVAIFFAIVSWFSSKKSKQYSTAALNALEGASSKHVVSQLSKISQIGNECLEQFKYIEMENIYGPTKHVASMLCVKISNFVTSVQSAHTGLEQEALVKYFQAIEKAISDIESHDAEELIPNLELRKLKSEVSLLVMYIATTLNNQTFANSNKYF